MVKQDPVEVILKSDDHAGFVQVDTGNLDPGSTTESVQAANLADDQKNSPDAALCQKPETVQLNGGAVTGQGYAICLTVTPNNGQAFRGVDFYVTAVIPGDKPLLCQINVFASAGNFKAVVDRVGNSLDATVFKLAPH